MFIWRIDVFSGNQIKAQLQPIYKTPKNIFYWFLFAWKMNYQITHSSIRIPNAIFLSCKPYFLITFYRLWNKQGRVCVHMYMHICIMYCVLCIDCVMVVCPINRQIKLLLILQLFTHLLFTDKMEVHHPSSPTSASSLTILRM